MHIHTCIHVQVFSAELYASDSGFHTTDAEEQKINVGFRVIRSLFAGWRRGRQKLKGMYTCVCVCVCVLCVVCVCGSMVMYVICCIRVCVMYVYGCIHMYVHDSKVVYVIFFAG